MGRLKQYLFRVCDREFGEITPENIEKAIPIAKAELQQLIEQGNLPKLEGGEGDES